EVPRSGEHPVRALLPCADSSVPVSSSTVQGGRLQRAAPSLLDLRQQGGRREAQGHAGNGRIQALARRARGVDWPTPDGRWCDGRILRAAQDVARSAEQRENGGVVAAGSHKPAAKSLKCMICP